MHILEYHVMLSSTKLPILYVHVDNIMYTSTCSIVAELSTSTCQQIKPFCHVIASVLVYTSFGGILNYVNASRWGLLPQMLLLVYHNSVAVFLCSV